MKIDTYEKYLALDFKGMMSHTPVTRRDFLKYTGGGLIMFFTLGDVLTEAQEGGRRWGRGLPGDFNAFLRIGEDGRVSCFTGKIEMGQGIVTSLAQMLADELDVSLDSVDMVMGDTDLCPWDMGTWGSLSTRFFGPPLRAAGAEARHVLLELASEYLNTPIGQLIVEDGIITDTRNTKHQVSYGELVKGKMIERRVKGKIAVKTPPEFNIIGKPVTRRDAFEKVTGEAQYTGDIQFPDMLYAKILRPPVHGAKLAKVDTSDVKQIEGVQIVEDGDFIAVLHRYPDEAEKAFSQIRAEFDVPEATVNETNIFEHLLKVAPEGETSEKAGELRTGEQRAVRIFEETYFDGYVAHAPMEPHAAVITREGERIMVWASTQTPFRTKDAVADVLGVPPDNVRVMMPFVGGGFGGKTDTQHVVEAARLLKVTGRPVQVAWSREEEFFYDHFRPAAIVKIRSGVTDSGKIALWDYHVYFAGQRGAELFYRIPHHRVMIHGSGWRVAPGTHPFATGAWRGPGCNTNTFARESQLDIMAAHAGIDPLEFRLNNLTDQHMKRVLQTAAETFGWTPAKTPSGRGVGIACGIDAGTYVATIAEVEVNKQSGKVQVKRVVCVQDMGLVINPAGATIQMEGCITMGLGYALTEDIHFKGGEIFDRNFDTYEIPRFSWLPKIETVLIDDQNSPAQGGGEPAITVMGAVIANAIYDAIGVRLFQLPMNPKRIKDALTNT